MKNFKKFAASLAAFTTALSLSVGALSVSANEIRKDIDKTFAEKAFVNSFHDDDCSTVAKYLLKSGISLDEVKAVMQLYVEGEKEEENEAKKMRKASGTKGASNKPDFYSTTKLSCCNHYGVVLSDKGNVHINNIDYYLSSDNSIVDLKKVSGIRKLNAGVDLKMFPLPADQYVIFAFGNVNISLPRTKPACIFDFPLEIKSTENTSEYDVHDNVTLDVDKNGSNTSENYRFETYVTGDFDHNGRVDVRDLRRVANYISGINNSILTDYNDIDANTAEKVNLLSADMDRNNTIDADDVTKLTDYILTHDNSER